MVCYLAMGLERIPIRMKVAWKLEKPLATRFAVWLWALNGYRYAWKWYKAARTSWVAEKWCLWSLFFHAPLFLCDVFFTALGDLLKQPTYLWVLAIPNKIKLLRNLTKHPFFICFAIHSLYSYRPGVVQKLLFEWTVYTLIREPSCLNMCMNRLDSCSGAFFFSFFLFECVNSLDSCSGVVFFFWMRVNSLDSCLGAFFFWMCMWTV